MAVPLHTCHFCGDKINVFVWALVPSGEEVPMCMACEDDNDDFTILESGLARHRRNINYPYER
jgi:hypothetical protein